MKRSSIFWLMMVALIAGCSGSESTPEEGANADGPSGEKTGEKWVVDGNTPKPDVKSELPPRTTTDGRWQLMMARQGAELPILLVDIESKGEKPAVKVVSVAAEVEQLLQKKPSVESSEISPQTVQMKFQFVGDAPWEFDGKLVDGEIVGLVLMSPQQAAPARMFATESTTLRDAQPSPMSTMEPFMKAVKSKDSTAALLDFARKNPTSPLALDAFGRVFSEIKPKSLKPAEIEALAREFNTIALRWGPRMQMISRVQAAEQLTVAYPEVALKLFKEIETDLAGDDKNPMLEVVKNGQNQAIEVQAMYERLAKIENAGKQLEDDSPEEQKKGEETLLALLKESPQDYGILYTLGRHAEKSDRPDVAIDYYSRIVALPMAERLLQSSWEQTKQHHAPPSENLEILWKKKHGKLDGLEQEIEKVYEENIYGFADERQPPRASDAGNKVALLELFTGSQCPPCVAADLVLGGIESTYDEKDLIVLRYHQHVPAEDPLANPDSEARFFYYEGNGTPTVALNGRKIDGIGGYLPHVTKLYKSVRTLVETALTEKTDVVLKLSAEAKDGSIEISADAIGLPKDADNLKLRLVLAEANVPFSASNGIRQHEMLVRAMPGAPGGVAAAEGKASIKTTLKLSDFKQKLVDYLAGYEEQQNVSFKDKPLSLDKLVLVAFVQNDSTREVLQSAKIPVTGDIQFGPEKAPKVPDENPKPEEPKPEKPTENKPATEKPTDPKPKDENAGETKPGAEKPAEKKPASEKPADEKPETAKPDSTKPETAKPETANEPKR